MKHFQSALELSDLRNDLKKLIKEKQNSTRSRLLQFIKLTDRRELVGTIKDDAFVVWTYDSSLTGIFYPILCGKLQRAASGSTVEIRTRLNELGLFFIALVYGSLGYGLATSIVIQNDNSLKFVVARILISLLLLVLFSAVPLLSYWNVRKSIFEFLENELKLE